MADDGQQCRSNSGSEVSRTENITFEPCRLAWIVLGLIAGFIASKIVNKQGEGFFLDVILRIVGVVAGGWIF